MRSTLSWDKFSVMEAQILTPVTKPEKAETAQEVRLPLSSEADLLKARKLARMLATKLDFWSVEKTFIVTAVSEIALNILQDAGKGEIILGTTERGDGTPGILIVARDLRPASADIGTAMKGTHSSNGRPGQGLAAARRLMDEFEIISEPGKGTRVVMKKWVR